MKTCLAFVIVVGMWVCLIGCQDKTENRSILGVWECTNLASYEHISHFSKLTHVFKNDGKVVSYLTGESGQETPKEEASFRIDGNILRIGDGQAEYRISFSGSNLVLTIKKAVNQADLGKFLIYQPIVTGSVLANGHEKTMGSNNPERSP
jgi:hypothetical protein